jgi:protein ImuA
LFFHISIIVEIKRRKKFFFEKKNQKTFRALSRTFPATARQRTKSFLLLFCKKEGLPSSLDPTGHREQNTNMPIPDALRHRIRQLERPAAHPGQALPFGIPALDSHLPEGGLASGAWHEISGGGPDAVPAASAALFAAGILARLAGPILWCAATRDLFPPGLACAGLHPDRVIHAHAPDEHHVLLSMEEALRHPALAAVLGELVRLPMTASRRLVLAAEKSGVMALALRRRAEGKPGEAGLTAAATRWRITPLPSAPLPVPGLGRARWQVELTRCRNAGPKTWMMEACDAQGRLSIPADLAHRPAAQIRGAA